jgi:purine-binding chemotaxis protein CheW
MSTTQEAVPQLAEGEVASDANQYLTFRLGNEDYGVDILSVQEIKGYVQTTRLPNSPPEIIGVLNLRGTVVPIIDLRRKFGLEEVEYTSFTAIVVVVVRGRVMGMIVDSVSEVVNIPQAHIQPPPDFGDSTRINFIKGMAKREDALITLLDIETVLLGERSITALAA